MKHKNTKYYSILETKTVRGAHMENLGRKKLWSFLDSCATIFFNFFKSRVLGNRLLICQPVICQSITGYQILRNLLKTIRMQHFVLCDRKITFFHCQLLCLSCTDYSITYRPLDQFWVPYNVCILCRILSSFFYATLNYK